MISALVECLATFQQGGNIAQVEVIARTMLAAMPDDPVALQFLGLALYQAGRIAEAQHVLGRVARRMGRPREPDAHDCESTEAATFRAATQVHPGLADGWYRIALVMDEFGFHHSAEAAFEASLAASGLTSKKRRRSTDDVQEQSRTDWTPGAPTGVQYQLPQYLQ
jgi:hypothetical protein